MKFIIVKTQCDWPGCDVVGTEGDGIVVERTIADGSKFPKTFQVCKPHNDELDEILLPLLAKALKSEAVGAKIKKTPSSTSSSEPGVNVSDVPEDGRKTKEICRVPGCSRPFGGRAGLGQHVIRTHGYPNLQTYDNDVASGRIPEPTTSG